MKFTSQRFEDVCVADLRHLHTLTNHPSRGDVNDAGYDAGSLFRMNLDDRLCDAAFPETWVVLARADSDDRIVAWCMVRKHDNSRLHLASASVGFYVHPGHRRSGIGSRLIREARDIARKIGVGRMVANPWNKSSREFFNDNGFRPLASAERSWDDVAVLELDSDGESMAAGMV